jgi:hypothetical protein
VSVRRFLPEVLFLEYPQRIADFECKSSIALETDAIFKGNYPLDWKGAKEYFTNGQSMFNAREGNLMKRGFALRAWVYFLCISFLLLANGFHTMVAEAKELGRPLGEMVSRGEVKFESRKGVWKPVDPSQFPIFQRARIKTENGASLIALENKCQIDVGENSLLSFERNDQIHLTQGAVNFRLPATVGLSIKVGTLTVIRSNSLQASQNPSAVSPDSEATVGSISVHPNGAVTVKSLRGSLSVLNQERAVLASLSSKDTVTLPSVTVKVLPKETLVQAGKKTINLDPHSKNFLGIPDWGWAVIVCAVGITASVVVIATTDHGGGGSPVVLVCP